MQLLVLVLMLMALGNEANVREIGPILESMAGEGATEVIRQAKELNSVISAVQSLSALAKSPRGGGDGADNFTSSARSADNVRADVGDNFGAPLAPVSRIADEEIIGCLARYIALGE